MVTVISLVLRIRISLAAMYLPNNFVPNDQDGPWKPKPPALRTLGVEALWTYRVRVAALLLLSSHQLLFPGTLLTEVSWWHKCICSKHCCRKAVLLSVDLKLLFPRGTWIWLMMWWLFWTLLPSAGQDWDLKWRKKTAYFLSLEKNPKSLDEK